MLLGLGLFYILVVTCFCGLFVLLDKTLDMTRNAWSIYKRLRPLATLQTSVHRLDITQTSVQRISTSQTLVQWMSTSQTSVHRLSTL